MYEQPRGVTCPQCGSTQFYAASFQRHCGWRSSSTPGGELSSQGNAIVVLVCLCGYPVETIGTLCLPPGERETFQRSLEGARRYREEVEPENVEDSLRAAFAERGELQATAKQVVQLRKIVEALKNDSDEGARAMSVDSRPRTRRNVSPGSENGEPELRDKASKLGGKE